jgi:hypothetical protein
MALCVLTYNLMLVLNIAGIKPLMVAIRGLSPALFSMFRRPETGWEPSGLLPAGYYWTAILVYVRGLGATAEP